MNAGIEDKSTSVEDLYNKVKDYAETKLELYKLKAVSKVSGFLSTFIIMIILLLIFFTVILCISIGAALLIGKLLGAAFYGFFVIAALYIIIGLVLYSMRNNLIKRPISNKLIEEMAD